MNKINFYHSLIFFNACIFLSAFEYLRENNLLIFSLFLILSLGISHGALDHIKGRKLVKILNYKSTISFYILYIFIGLSIIFLWLIFPKILFPKEHINIYFNQQENMLDKFTKSPIAAVFITITVLLTALLAVLI